MEKSDLQRFRNECVAAHNFYRAAHGTPPLCWSTRLAESAQAWAEHLASTTGSLRYSSAKDVGENLTLLWGSELNGQKITRIWYEEGKHFDDKRPRVNSRTRSFCQVVWEGTRELGAGAAITKHGKQIVVARYFPPMNKKNVARNVKKAKSMRGKEQPLTFDTRWSSLYVGLKEFHEECLSAHNEYRIRHGAAPLHWSAELAWEAQQWAENLARTGELRHNDDDTVGENLAGMVGGELSGREAVDMWYEEIESYDFESPGYSEDTSNFTQVVWVASEHLGVGRAIDGELCVVVAFYEPPGNMERYFGENVLRMGSTVRERKSKEPKGFIPPPPDLEGFRLECLVTHNYFRARHGSPPLVLNSALTDEAQYWAERLLVTGASEGLDNSRIGISVAVLENKHISGIKVSELWYKQILSYDFNSPGFSTETLDFSQLVWLSTRKLGVGKATGAEGVTVVVARYEPVGNIDGLFVQNVRRRGYERGSSEPMIFHVDYKYRIRADSKSSNSFLSWEHEDAPTLERGGDVTKSSDFDHFDVNKNMVHTAEEQDPTATLTVTDAFTRLVWIDPNSPTLQRKGVAEEAIQGVDNDEEEEVNDEMKADEGIEDEYGMEEEQDDEYEMGEEQDEEDARTAYEEENRVETEEEPSMYREEAELEEADLFSDPEDDLYQHVCEIRRSLSLDSDGTEPEVLKGNVLSKVAFFETFQRETHSPSNSESSFRRSLIQEELEELASRPRRQVSHEENEQAQTEHEEEEPECQLEFDDIFPAHREEDEVEVHVDETAHDEACEGDDESLVSVSDAEDVLDSTGYDTGNVGIQDYEFENSYCVTHEFIEEEPSTLEIFDFSDEEASHQYADLTEQPRSSTKSILATTDTSVATEFHKKESFKSCEEEPPRSMEDPPEYYSKELFQTSEASVEVPETFSTKSLHPDLCLLATKQDDVGNRMEELISRVGLLSVEETVEDSNEILDLNETIEGKLLTSIVSREEEYKVPDKQIPLDETCEALVKDSVESEIDFDDLFTRLERDETESEGDNAIPQTVMEIETSQSPDNLCEVIIRAHVRERSIGMGRLSSDLEVQTSDQFSASEAEEEKDVEPEITLHYESPTLLTEDDIEPVAENIEAVERKDKPERTVDLEGLEANIDGLTRKDTSEGPMEEEYCEAVLRDHNAERTRVYEEIGLVSVSPDDKYSVDEPVEPLPYHPAPKSTIRELHEVTEIIDAEARQDTRCEINFEELFHSTDEDNDDRFSEEMKDESFDTVEDNTDTAVQEELYEAVLRDNNQQRAKDLHEVSSEIELIPVSREGTDTFNEPVEPLPYDQAPVLSTEDQLPEVTEVISAEVRQHLRSEINFEETFSHLEEQTAEYVDEMAESTVTAAVESPSRTSLFLEEDTMIDDVEHCSPSTSTHISHETENYLPTKEIAEVDQAVEPERPASLYKEEEAFVVDVTAEIPSSPNHIAGEGVYLERMEVVSEVKERKEEKRASLIVDECERVTEVPSESLSSQNIAGEMENVAPFEQARDETEVSHYNRASLYMEEDPVVQKVAPDVFSSPRHISNECENIMLEETEVPEQRDEQRASLYMEENTMVDSMAIKEASLCPLYIACETQNIDPKTQIEEGEQPEDVKCPLTYSEEVTSVAEIKSDTPLSPKHIACECTHADFVEGQEPTEQENRASIYWEDEVQVEEIVYDIPASPNHVAGESVNTEFIEEVRELTEGGKRASLFVEEETTLSRVTTGTTAAMHVAGERVNKESIEEICKGEPLELEKRSSVFLEEDSVIHEVIPGTLSSPRHIAGESQSVDLFEEVYEECIEERKRASLFLEETVAFDELTTDTPSSPRHFAGEVINREMFEETEVLQEYENKRASLFVEENVSHCCVFLEDLNRNQHVAAQILNSVLLQEVTDDEDSPESDYGERFEEFEGTCSTGTYVEPPKAIYIAGEVQNSYTDGKAAEDILQLEESVKYEDFQQTVTTSIFAEKPQPPIHIAEELSNVIPREESSEEEKMEEEAFAEEIEDTQFQASTVLLKSPQSLLSIAAAVLEQNIDAVQQEAPEEFTAETDVAQQYSEEEHADVKLVMSEDFPSNTAVAHEIESSMQREETVETTVTLEHSPVLYDETEVTDDMVTDKTKVPVIRVDFAGKISDEEDDNVVYVEEEHQDTDAKKAEGYEEKMTTAYPTEEQSVQSHAAAEFCISEVVLEDDVIRDQEEYVESFEESEESSVSELLSECSSSPLHVSSELKDFHDFETINEEYGSETYHAITYEEGDYVSEMPITKGLPPLFITEELARDMCKESTLNEESVVVETAQEYSEAENALPTQTSLVTYQSPLQTTTELSDSNYTDGVEEEDERDEREFAEEFTDREGIEEKATDIQFEVLSAQGELVTTIDPQTAEDETDNAQKFGVQELVLLPAANEQVVHKEKILQEVWEVEVTKGSQRVETCQEKHKNGQFQRSVETKSRYWDLESRESHSVSQTQRGEIVVTGEQGTQMEVSHKMEKQVEVLSTRTVHHSSSTTFTSAEEVTTEENQYHLKTNGACISREEVKNIEEISFTEIQQTSQQRLWIKEEMGSPVESNDELSESILERETKDQELRTFERELSKEETEVRLMKSEVLEYKAVEQQVQLVNPRVTVERETTLVKAFVVQSAANEGQEQTLMREDNITAILKDDEAFLEEESAGEQFEEEIDIMRVDEALSEEEFRGEGADKVDRLQSRSSKSDSVEEMDKGKERESPVRGSDQQNVLYEGETGIIEEDPFYEEECEVKRVEEVLREPDDRVVESLACVEEVEVTAFGKKNVLMTENLELSEEIKRTTQSPVFEEELEISALPAKESSYHDDDQERDKKVDPLEMLEEEVEVVAFTSQEEPTVLEEELEVEHVEKQKTEKEVPSKQVALFKEEIEISTVPSEEEPVKAIEVVEGTTERRVLLGEEHHTDTEEHEGEIAENAEHARADLMKSEDQTDEESANQVEISHLSTQREPLDLSQVDLYDEDESALGTRYYVELSSTESLEPHYEEVEDETCYPETYVRQGDPLEENLEEFILVRYGDEFESSGEEDISDHREIYVIPEEENDVENHDVGAARDVKVDVKDSKADSFFGEGSENTGLEEIRESPEFDMDDSDELDEEELRQLEEYERLESFVILEEKLSQVESDDEEIADLDVEAGDENVFHSDVHSSSEETLHEDELAQTMIASSIQQASAFTEPEYKQGEPSHGDGCTQTQEQISTEQEEQSVEHSPSRKEDSGYDGGEVSSVEIADSKSPPNEEAGNKSLSEDLPDKKEYSELSTTKEEKTEQQLSSDSSGEQSVSSEGSLSSTPSVDLEGLDNFEQDCLLHHNLYRRQHRVKPLKWSEELAEGAKRWSEHLASVNTLESFVGKDVGENLASVEGKELSATEAVDMWYKEVEDYNFEDPAFNAKCGRFTQVVWASSREFGVARFLASDGTQYIVARYKPTGNVLGEFKENVKPPRDPSSRLKRRRSSVRRRSRSGTPSTPAEKEKFKTECVISHNYYRTFHNAPALRWSPLLAAEAQNYAERLAKTDSLTHSGQKDRGENLAYTWDSPLSARAAIDMWYDEVQDYDFESPGFTSDTGHFTQLVWVGTEEFGMGMAVAPDGRNIVIAKYFPPGNIVGQFKENVRPREIEGIP